MHESTNITYGSGSVTIVFNSESVSEIPAPVIRAGDFNELAFSCFTKKELNEINDGASAEVTFSYVMYDEAPNEKIQKQFEDFISEDKVLQHYNNGFYVDVISFKTVGNNPEVEFTDLSHDIELQLEVPLFLRNNKYEYCCIVNNIGACKVLPDTDEEADTVSLNTDSTGCYLLLYKPIDLGKDNESHRLRDQYFFLIGIIALLGLLAFMEKLRGKEK